MNDSENFLEELVFAVSACLLGENCKYSGGNNYHEGISDFLSDKKVVAVCPEVLGGLSTPRPPAEIVDGHIINVDGVNLDEEFSLGADRALDQLKNERVGVAILKSRSPSCGSVQIYDGSFSGVLIEGMGIFAKALVDAGLEIVDSDQFDDWQEDRFK